MQHFCACMEMPSWSSVVLPLILPYLICICPIPSWSHPSQGSFWCDTTTQKLCCHVGIHMMILGCKASVKDARPLIWAPLPQQAQECQHPCLSVWDLTASSRMQSTTSLGSHCQCFLDQAVKAWGVCSNSSGHESNGPRNESITLPIRFNVPLEMTYICISSHYLKLVSGAYFPLACASSALFTADKVSKFPFLMLSQMQSQFTCLHLLQNKKTLGSILN